jgi:hypothetical protein
MAKSTAAIEIEVVPKGNAESTVKSFKTQLKEAKIEAQQLVATFGEFSQEALAGQQKVANLSDQMEDFNDRVKALNPDKFAKVQTVVSGVASGFSAAQGAMALFGSESEDLQKTLVKVQGAMALSQGLAGLGAVQQQFTALYTTISGPVIAAFGRLRLAIGSAFAVTGVAAAITAVVLLYQKFTEHSEKLAKEREKQQQSTQNIININEESLKIQEEEIKSIGKLLLVTDLENVSKEDKKKAIQEIQKVYPDYLKNQDLDKISTDQIKQANNELIVTIGKRAKAQAALQELNKLYTKQVELELKLQGDGTDLLAKRIELTNKGLTPDQVEKQIQSEINLKNAVDEKIKSELKEIKVQEDKIKNYINEGDLSKFLTETQIKNTDKKDKKEDDSAQKKLERDAKLAALNNETIAQRVAAADKEFATTVKQLKEQGFTQVQINQLRDAALEKVREEYAAKVKSDNEKLIAQQKTDTDAANKILLEAYDQYYGEQILIAKASGKTKEQIERDVQLIEIQNLEDKLVSLKDSGDATVEIESQIFEKKKAIRDKEAADDLEREKNKQEGIYNIANSSLSALSSLNEAFASDSEESQKRAFEIDKALKYASTIMATIQGTQEAFSSANKSPITAIFPAYPYVQAGAALAFGLANLKKISDTKFQSKSSPSAGGNRAAGGGGVPQMEAPRMSSLGNGNELTQDRRVYVTEGDISRTQKRVSNNQSVSVVE